MKIGQKSEWLCLLLERAVGSGFIYAVLKIRSITPASVTASSTIFWGLINVLGLVHSSTFVKTRDYRYNISEIFALSGYYGVEKMSRLCSIAEYGLARVLVVSGNIVKNLTSKFSHRLKITILRERSAENNNANKCVLFRDIIEKFVLRNFSICIGLKSNCVWLSRLWGLRGLAPVLPSGSPHRPIARFRSNP